MKKDYTVSVLSDYSRLDEIYRLTHDAFVLSGEILPQGDGMINTCPHLDNHPNTIIVIAELKGEIIGTITATVDSSVGLNIENWFKNEVDEYRRADSYNLGSSWRLATISSFRGSRMLIVDLISKAFELLIEAGCTICLCALMNKHIRSYQRLMDAKIVLTKNVEFNQGIPMELNLMEIDLGEGWSMFKQLKTG
ncbi:MAG: hypothetical protein GQ532_01550 [Methylomarinum sp.]|nr:hypothetical protein [Methylomarinum sp.]